MADAMETDAGRSIRVDLDPDLTQRFEDWRRRQPVIPSASEAVRRLLARALTDEQVAA
jgi:hypothetical protein